MGVGEKKVVCFKKCFLDDYKFFGPVILYFLHNGKTPIADPPSPLTLLENCSAHLEKLGGVHRKKHEITFFF